MFSFPRKGIRRRGRAANRSARRTAGRMVIRLAVRLARPFGPGVLAAAAGSYFLDRAAGSERRKQALNRLGGVGKLRGKKTD